MFEISEGETSIIGFSRRNDSYALDQAEVGKSCSVKALCLYFITIAL